MHLSSVLPRLVVGIAAVVVLAALGSRIETTTASQPAHATSVETGFGFTCAVISDGSVQCWGENNGGQLGDGTDSQRLTPTPVVGLPGAVESVVLGDAHACALTVAGGVVCWGYNGEGELGDGTGQDSYSPVGVTDLGEGVSDIGAGELHTCAVLDTSTTRCWGFNDLGQLGDGTTDDALSPVSVSGLSNGVQVDGGEDDFTCATTMTGAAKCWGNNDEGHLGAGLSDDFSKVPVQVSGLTSGVESVSAGGNHACALMTNNTVRCWGRGFEGQLGNGTFANRPTPVQVSNLNDAVEISAGVFQTCALKMQGKVVCWGSNASGQLGDGSNDNSNEPVFVDGLDDVVHIAGGYYHTCAVKEDGTVWCWGGGNRGQLGTGTLDDSNVPVQAMLAEVSSGVQRTWGDGDCGGTVNLGDAIGIARHLVSLPVNQGEGCPALGSPVTVGGADRTWQDVDCGGGVSLGDAIGIARFLVSLPVNQAEGCPEVGATVEVR